MKRLVWLLIIVTVPLILKGQAAGDYQSFQSGSWNDVNTWERFDGSVWVNPAPSTPTNADGVITILGGHTVDIPALFSVSIDQTTIASTGALQIDATGSVTVINGPGGGNDLTITGGSILDVSGTLICNNGALISGSTTSTTTFQSGGVYEHQYTTTQGVIPLANWDATQGAASTLRITGYTTFTTATGAGNWGQSFGNVEWNCTAQTAIFNLGGLLTSVGDNLDVLATGTGANPGTLRFGTTGSVTITVPGNFNVAGDTEIGFCTSGTSTVDVTGNYTQNLTAGYVRFADGSNNGVGTLNITGNFDLQAGTLTETGGGTAQGNINFVGSAGTVHTFTEAGTPITIMTNTLSYSVADDNELTVVGESQLAAGATSFFLLGTNAILYVESTDALGAIQLGTGQGATTGNLRVTNANRTFNAGSQIVYNGSGPQFMGNGQPTVATATTVINNGAGVTQVAASTLSLLGNLTLQTGDLTILNATFTVSGITDIQADNILFITAATARTLTFNGDVTLGGNITVTSGTANANLIFAGDISGGGIVSFSGVNSNLTINGTGDLVFPLTGPTDLETLTYNRTGETTFTETLNVNTNAGASLMSITAGIVDVNGDFNGRGITLTNGSSLVITGNTNLTNTLTITDGTVQTDGTLSITNDLVITVGSLDANGSVTLTDDLTLGPGTTFFFEDQTVTLNSQLTNNGGVFSSSAGSVLNILNAGVLGTIAFDPGGNILGTFTLNRPTGGTLVTLNSALTVSGTFDLLDGGFLNTSGLDFDDADVTRNSAASFIAGSAVPTGTYDLFLTGAGMTTGVEAQGALVNVTSTSSGIVTLGGAMTATGNLLISSGTFTSGANDVSVFTLTNNGTTFNAPSTTLTINDDLINNGTFNRNNGTVDFSGVNSTISGSVNPTFQNIIISGTLTSPATLNLTGNFTNDGLFIPASGTVVFTNTVNGLKTIDGTQLTTFNNITIQNNTANPDVSISGNVEVQGVLTLNITAILDADGAGTGVLTILSTGDSPTADGRIAALSGVSTLTGNFTVQRYMSGEGRIYRYISSPVQGASVADWQDDFPITGPFADPNTEFPIGSGITSICGFTLNPASLTMFYYDEVTKAYVTYPSSGTAASNPLQVGRGYSAFIRECTNPTIIDVRGTMVNGVNSGNVILPVTHTAAVTDFNNLVGNPYPSQIDWDLVTINGSVSPTIAIRDNGTGSFRYHTQGSAPVDLPNGVIATGQAFWVRTTAAAPTVTVTEASKSGTSGNVFFRERNGQDLLAIELLGSTQSSGDKAFVILLDSTLQDFDKFDAPKMNNYIDSPFKELFDLSTREASGKSLALNYLPAIPCGFTLPLVAKDLKVGSFTFNFDQIGSLAAYNITLTDNFLSTTVNVTQNPSYAFAVTSDAASKSTERFVLNFSDQVVALDLLVDSEVIICGSNSAKVNVYNSQPGVDYYLIRNGIVVSDSIIGNGENIELTVSAQNLEIGSNQVEVKAYSGCGGVYTLNNQSAIILKQSFTPNVSTPASKCQEGSFTLLATGAPAGTVVNWYDAENAIVPLLSGTEFITPLLTQSKTYYASIVSLEGCEGTRIPVEAAIIQFEDVEILVSSDSLMSSYESGNQWYWNNQIIPGATDRILVADISGVYKVEVSVPGNCTTSAELSMVITGEEQELSKGFSVYPNPVKDVIQVTLTNDFDANVVLMDSYGRKLNTMTLSESTNNLRQGSFDVRSIPQGFYYVKAVKSNRSVFIKIIKQ